MDGLRLFGKCEEAARSFSKQDAVDVLVICGNSSAFVYTEGRAREIPWVTETSRPQPQGGQAEYVEPVPIQVQFGHWDSKTDVFTTTRKMKVDEFLNLAVMMRRTASAS